MRPRSIPGVLATISLEVLRRYRASRILQIQRNTVLGLVHSFAGGATEGGQRIGHLKSGGQLRARINRSDADIAGNTAAVEVACDDRRRQPLDARPEVRCRR